MEHMTPKSVMSYLRRKRSGQPSRPEKAALWEKGHPRNEALKALKAGELNELKLTSVYRQHSMAETAMYRFKQLITAKLSLRNCNTQVGEAMAGVKAMNKMIGLVANVETWISRAAYR